MNIYDIDQAIEALIDAETGEVCDLDAFLDLQMEKEAKIENIALWYKNLTAEADAIKAERNALAGRETAAKNKADSLKKYLDVILNGEKFKTPKVAITYRKSSAVQVDDTFLAWAKENAVHLLRHKDPDVDKTAVKDAINAGQKFELARVVENQSLQIK